MTAIRTVSAIALMTFVAGCAGTQQAVVTAPVKPVEPVVEAPAAVEPVVVALPERVDTYEPITPALIDVGPLDRPVAAAPALIYEPLEVVTVDVVEAAPAPVYEPVAVVEPVYEPVVEPVATVAALPAVPTSRGMSPIYDDPEDSRADRSEARQHAAKTFRPQAVRAAGGPPARVRSVFTPIFGARLEQAALGRLNPEIRYDARYIKIGYPWGDVPGHTGVCTDVIIRSYRALGIDLQQLVHEDMRRAFSAYPSRRIYGLKSADANIDHRRVVNLEAFFERTGASVPLGTSPEDFQPGDVLTWRLSGNEPHIGIVIAERDRKTGYPLVVHNLGAGVRKDDLITIQTPVGHYRFAPDTDTRTAQLGPRAPKTDG